MLLINTLLEFENIFPEERPQEIIDLLKKVDNNTLLSIIGFSNTNSMPNYYNFFKNKKLQINITAKTNIYLNSNLLIKNPVIISRMGSLKLAEIILGKKKIIFKAKKELSNDKQELNLFKSFLSINKIINTERQQITGINRFEEVLNFSIVNTFPFSDLGLHSPDFEFYKLVIATLVKQNYLFEYLSSDKRFDFLGKGLAKSFNKNNLKELSVETKYLFKILIELKVKNSFKLNIKNEESKSFLNTLCSEVILPDSDFTNLKNSPLYKIDENVYSIVDYFFVVDKFYKSVKFKLKEIYSKDLKLVSLFGDFFSFYNLYFSERILMKNVLDDIFEKKYFHKINYSNDELAGQPDYYIRHNNNVFLFENKDILIRREIKSSGSIEEIENVLKNKLLIEGERPVGIGQLINHIESIVSGDFKFDDKVNNKNFKIYPILILQDRIFESLGINYKLNTWFRLNVKERLGLKYNPNYIKDLTIIDIDTLIYLRPYFKQKDRYFKDLISTHIRLMTNHKKVNHRDRQEGINIANRNIARQLSPISSRVNYVLNKKQMVDILTIT